MNGLLQFRDLHVYQRTREFQTDKLERRGKSGTARPILRRGLGPILTAVPAPPRRALGCLPPSALHSGAAASLPPAPASARTIAAFRGVRGGAQNRKFGLARLRNGVEKPILARRRPPGEAEARARRKVEGAAADNMAAVGSVVDQGDRARLAPRETRRTRSNSW